MYCKKCGNKLEEGWYFCPECNHKIVVEKTIKTEDDAQAKKVFNVCAVTLSFIIFIGGIVGAVLFSSYFWIFIFASLFALVYALVVHFRYLITKIMFLIFLCVLGVTTSFISLLILHFIDALSRIKCF